MLPGSHPSFAAALMLERKGIDYRRVDLVLTLHKHGAAATFLEGSNLPIPYAVASRTTAPFIWTSSRRNGATDAAVQADLAALPAALDRVDALIAEGTIGGDEPNAADYQIATS